MAMRHLLGINFYIIIIYHNIIIVIFFTHLHIVRIFFTHCSYYTIRITKMLLNYTGIFLYLNLIKLSHFNGRWTSR